MPIVKAQCTNCGGNLEVDNSKDAAICPFCNTPYVVQQAINKFNVSSASINVQSANINVSGHLDADTMFENWVVTNDSELRKDFKYYYATDPRNEYMDMWGVTDSYGNRLLKVRNRETLEKLEPMVEQFFTNDRFYKYYGKEKAVVESLRRSANSTGPIKILIIYFLIILGVGVIAISWFL